LKSAPFRYVAPGTVEEALELLAEHGDDARPLAGGQSLVPMMAFRLARPSVLIDLNRIGELAAVRIGASSIGFGAMVRERTAERSPEVRAGSPLLARALPLIGHEAIRSRGTIGGSLSHADPAGELPAVAVASGAEMVVRAARRSERVVAAEEFFVGHFTTALEADELLVEVRFPRPTEGTGAAFEEMTRRHGDFAIVGVAALLHISGGSIDHARVVLTGVGATPVRVAGAESVLIGASPGEDLFEEAAGAAIQDLDPPSDLHGSAAYRRHVAGILIRRALARTADQIAAEPIGARK
jgi:carbon-monoxide dehydrogenase medium subunit